MALIFGSVLFGTLGVLFPLLLSLVEDDASRRLSPRRYVFLWLLVLPVVWILLLVAAVLLKVPWLILALGVPAGAVCLPTISALNLIRKASTISLDGLAKLGCSLSEWPGLSLRAQSRLPLWLRLIQGAYVAFAIPFIATGKILKFLGEAGTALTEAFIGPIIHLLAGLNVSLFFVIILSAFQARHNLQIINPISFFALLAFPVLLVYLAQLGVRTFARAATGFVALLGMVALCFMGLIVTDSWFPSLSEVVALDLQNSYDWLTSNLWIHTVRHMEPNEIYYITLRRSIIKPCLDCRFEGNRVIGTVGQEREVEADTWMVASADRGTVVKLDRILMVPVYLATQNDPRHGFNQGELFLAVHEDLQPRTSPFGPKVSSGGQGQPPASPAISDKQPPKALLASQIPADSSGNAASPMGPPPDTSPEPQPVSPTPPASSALQESSPPRPRVPANPEGGLPRKPKVIAIAADECHSPWTTKLTLEELENAFVQYNMLDTILRSELPVTAVEQLSAASLDTSQIRRIARALDVSYVVIGKCLSTRQHNLMEMQYFLDLVVRIQLLDVERGEMVSSEGFQGSEVAKTGLPGTLPQGDDQTAYRKMMSRFSREFIGRMQIRSRN